MTNPTRQKNFNSASFITLQGFDLIFLKQEKKP